MKLKNTSPTLFRWQEFIWRPDEVIDIGSLRWEEILGYELMTKFPNLIEVHDDTPPAPIESDGEFMRRVMREAEEKRKQEAESAEGWKNTPVATTPPEEPVQAPIESSPVVGEDEATSELYQEDTLEALDAAINQAMNEPVPSPLTPEEQKREQRIQILAKAREAKQAKKKEQEHASSETDQPA